MKVIIVGCGRLGTELAYRLYRSGHEVSVIDAVANAFNNLPADFQGRLIEGDALNQDVLLRAGITEVDAIAVVTNIDTLNMVVGRIASKVYCVSRVIARNYDPICRSMFEDFELQVVSSSSWGAQRIEEMLYRTDVRAVFSAGNGEVEVYEVSVPEKWNGKLLSELVDSLECQPVALTHTGKAVLPEPDSRLATGDVVHLSATFNAIEGIRARINGQKRG
jgi:trk system potassium uptake protein TrkA